MIEQLAYVLVVCGTVMFILSFLGYCGAIRESQCLLTIVSILSYNFKYIKCTKKLSATAVIFLLGLTVNVTFLSRLLNPDKKIRLQICFLLGLETFHP